MEGAVVLGIVFLIVGLPFMSAMKKMAKFDSCETEKEKHWWLKALAAILILLLCTQLFGVLSSDPIKGFGNSVSLSIICCLLGGVIRYCVCYERSDCQWWKKILKFAWGLLFFIVGFVLATGIKATDHWSHYYSYRVREKYVSLDRNLIIGSAVTFIIMLIVTGYITAHKDPSKNKTFVQ